MRKMLAVIALFLLTIPGLCQAGSKYQVGTILEVKPHQENGSNVPEVTSYDVSVKVGDTIYVALYTPHLGEEGAKYAAGQDLLVQVRRTTIAYNDIMGNSYEVPIESHRPAPAAKEHSH